MTRATISPFSEFICEYSVDASFSKQRHTKIMSIFVHKMQMQCN